MYRLVLGIIIAGFGFLCFASAGHNPGGPTGSIVFGFLFVFGGGTMIFFGTRFLNRRKQITEGAFQMLRTGGKINAYELAQRLGINEIESRMHISQAQRKGIIPSKVDIV